MAPLKLPELNIGEDSANCDIEELMKIVKPEWQQTSIQIKKMSGGYSCSSYHCYLDDQPQGGVIIRVKKLFLGRKIPLLVEEFEHKTVELISERGIFPNLFAIFQNGYCYEYIPGEVLVNYSEVKDNLNLEIYEETTLKEIAHKLVSIHSLKMEDEDYTKSEFLNRLSEMLCDLYPELPDIPNKNFLKVELEQLARYAEQLQFKIVFCHGDAHLGNMIWNKDTREVTFIDWEVAHIGYQTLDVATILKALGFIDIIRGPEKCLPKETLEKLQTQFLSFYFEEWSMHHNNQHDFITFCNHVEFWKLMHYLLTIVLVGSWVADDKGIEPPMDAKQTMNFCFEKYMEEKNDIVQKLGLK